MREKYSDIPFVKLAKRYGFWNKLYHFVFRVSQYTGLSKRKILEKIDEVFSKYDVFPIPHIVEITLKESEKERYTITYACGYFALNYYEKTEGGNWLSDVLTDTFLSHVLKC